MHTRSLKHSRSRYSALPPRGGYFHGRRSEGTNASLISRGGFRAPPVFAFKARRISLMPTLADSRSIYGNGSVDERDVEMYRCMCQLRSIHHAPVSRGFGERTRNGASDEIRRLRIPDWIRLGILNPGYSGRFALRQDNAACGGALEREQGTRSRRSGNVVTGIARATRIALAVHRYYGMKVHVSRSIDEHDLSAMRNNGYLSTHACACARALCVPRNNNLAQERKIREALI